jgi:hypothetical protein
MSFCRLRVLNVLKGRDYGPNSHCPSQPQSVKCHIYFPKHPIHLRNSTGIMFVAPHLQTEGTETYEVIYASKCRRTTAFVVNLTRQVGLSMILEDQIELNLCRCRALFRLCLVVSLIGRRRYMNGI